MRFLHLCIIPALFLHVFAAHAAAQEPNSEIFQERVRNEKNGETLIETIFPSRKEYEAPCTRLTENARFTRRPGPVRFWITVNAEYTGGGQDLPIKSYGGFGDSEHTLQVREGKSFGSLETAGITRFLASLGVEEFVEASRGIHCIMVGST